MTRWIEDIDRAGVVLTGEATDCLDDGGDDWTGELPAIGFTLAEIADEPGELTEGSTVDDVIASFLRESAAYVERLVRPVPNGEEHDGRHP